MVAAEKRRLLNFVVSNSVWKDGQIVPVWRQATSVEAAQTNGRADRRRV
jgi:hypothetical protein